MKVRNHISGALDMVLVGIQHAGMLANQKKHVNLSNGNSGTYLILLSDDDSGFVPYRIDNFSMEVPSVFLVERIGYSIDIALQLFFGLLEFLISFVP